MTRFVTLTAALLLAGGAASAQVTTQEFVGGPTGIPEYPTRVVGENGVVYACQAPVVIDGITARRCITPDIGGTINPSAGGSAGTGFASMSPGAVGGLAAAIVLIAVVGESNGTNGTN